MKRHLSLLVFLLVAIMAYARNINNFSTPDGKPRLIPNPQQLTWTQGNDFILAKELLISAPTSLKNEVEIFHQILSKRFPGYSATPTQGTASIQLTLTDQNVPASPEGYKLSITSDAVKLQARSAAGIYYGIRTLGNMLLNQTSARLPSCEILDWPDLPKRGVYLRLRYLLPSKVDTFLPIIEAFASLKYNVLILEFGENFPYTDNPFTNIKNPLTLENIQAIQECCKRNYIEIQPFLQAISHDEWLRLGYPNYFTECAEDPAVKSWAASSCPLSEVANRLTKKAIKEQIEILKPKDFLLNFDEFILVCPWQKCAKCKAMDSGELAKKLVNDYVAFTFSLGVRPNISYDIINPGNPIKPAPLRNSLDKRTVIHNWDYGKNPKAERVQFFKNEGFPIMNLSYCESLENTRTLPLLSKKGNTLGCYLTYWHYMWSFYRPDQGCPEAYAATTTAAEYQWHTSESSIFSLDYDPAFETMRRFNPAQVFPAPEQHKGLVPLPIRHALNIELGSNLDFPQTNKAILTRLKAELKEAHFDLEISDNGKYYGCDLSQSPEIQIQNTLQKLTFLFCTGRPNDTNFFKSSAVRMQPKVGEIKIQYADGSHQSCPLHYRRQLNEWNTTSSGFATRFVNRFADLQGYVSNINAVDWRNPSPDKKIASIQLTCDKAFGASPLLLAISAQNPGKSSFTDISLAKALSRIPQTPVAKVKKTTIIDLAKFDTGQFDKKISFVTNGDYQVPVKREWIDDPTAPTPGKVLKITIPPYKDFFAGRGRVYLDIPIPENLRGTYKSLICDYRVDQPSWVNTYSLYLLSSHSGHLIWYQFNSFRDATLWQRLETPLNRMKKEAGGIRPEEGRAIRISFFIEFQTEPFHIYLGKVGVSPDEVPFGIPLQKAQ